MGEESDFANKRVLIFVVAYNAETTLANVLSRIPASLRSKSVEVLVIDDFSQDKTFSAGLEYEKKASDFKITTLRTPENQGYGGNQKLGYRYAIDHGFDVVALLHGDGQYAPEKLPDLLEPLLRGDAGAVLGLRLLDKGGAMRGGFQSSHTMAIDAARPGASVLDVGCGRGFVAEELAKKASHVTGIDQYIPDKPPRDNIDFHRWDLDSSDLPVDVARYDQVFMLDII